MENEILKNLRKIVRAIHLESKKIQKDFGISIPQLLTLNHLYNHPHFQATHKELANELELNSSTMTGIIDRLEKKNFVARLPNSKDKRSTSVCITNNGIKLLKNSPDLLHNTLAQRLNKLSEDKLKNINESLLELIQSLHIEDIDASPMMTIEAKIDE